MKLLIDFLPIVVFFVAFKVWGIYVATAVAIAATVLQIIWIRVRTGKVEPMNWVSLAVIVLFGGATIYLHDEQFIKWKPTILYWLTSGVLLGGQLFARRNLVRSMMGAQVELPDHAWRVLLWAWVVFFGFMGALNLWVAFNYDTPTWVNFKLFGGIGLVFVFFIGQFLYMMRFAKDEAAPE